MRRFRPTGGLVNSPHLRWDLAGAGAWRQVLAKQPSKDFFVFQTTAAEFVNELHRKTEKQFFFAQQNLKLAEYGSTKTKPTS